MYTHEELKEQGKGYFAQYPEVEYFHATSDGLFFLPEAKSDAYAHAKQHGHAVFLIESESGIVTEISEEDKEAEADFLAAAAWVATVIAKDKEAEEAEADLANLAGQSNASGAPAFIPTEVVIVSDKSKAKKSK